MIISSELFDAYLKCPTKCYLKARGEIGAGNTYAQWVKNQDETFRSDGIRCLTKESDPDWFFNGPAESKIFKTTKWRLAINLKAEAQNLKSTIHAVERVPSEGRGKPAQFIPMRFVFNNKLTKNDRMLSAFDALVLSKILERKVSLGTSIHGDNYEMVKVKTYTLAREVRKQVEKINTLLSNNLPPDLILNRHCTECEFQEQCRQRAIEKDELSLLAGMTEKERKKLNGKGIFTITQLSYIFRPRRRPKRMRDRQEKYHHSLKALAIREKKTQGRIG